MICLDVMYSLIKEVGLITPNPPSVMGETKDFFLYLLIEISPLEQESVASVFDSPVVLE